jgi:hypothetical protein
MENISLTYGGKNEEVLPRVKEEQNVGRLTGLVTTCVEIAIQNT